MHRERESSRSLLTDHPIDMRRLISLILALSFAAAACASSGPLPPAGPVSSADSSPTGSSSVAASPSRAGDVPVASQTRAEVAAQAARVATDWVGALRARDYATAWAALSAASQAAYGSMESFASDRDAFMMSARGIALGPYVNADPQALAEWLPAAPGADTKNAFIATVDYPQLAQRNNGQEVLVIAPDESGGWRVWVVR